jgi:hypothetical protein
MTTQTTIPILYRQGDVLLELVTAIPPSSALERNGDLILQEGEVTGHAHRIMSRHATLYRTELDARYLRVTSPVVVEHEEHSRIELPPGDYMVTIHAEYNPGELPRLVAD